MGLINLLRSNTLEGDLSPPKITIAGGLEAETENFILKGRVLDDSAIGTIEIAGERVTLAEDGSLAVALYIPRRGKQVEISAADIHGNRASTTISIARAADATRQGPSFAALDPTGISTAENADAIALVIGIGDYESAPDALYADRDAEFFADYVHRAFGVRDYNIKLLLDKEASRLALKRLLKRWLPGTIRAGETDVLCVFRRPWPSLDEWQGPVPAAGERLAGPA